VSRVSVGVKVEVTLGVTSFQNARQRQNKGEGKYKDKD
jgi:hypothetical protein